MKNLDDFPRACFAHLPSALDPLANLTQLLGGPQLWIKRDDQIGLGIGGNKTRKLEFLMGEALAQGARKVVTFGGLQSNHVRQTASAARRLGLEPHLFLLARRPEQMTGNLLLDELTGARLYFVGRGLGRHQSIERSIHVMGRLARMTPGLGGPDTYIIPVGGHSPIGALGYVNAAFELTDQAAERNLRVDYVVTAAGTGGTLAGLMAGFALRGALTRVIGVDVGNLWTGFRASIARLATETVQLLGGGRCFEEGDVDLVGGFVGQRYGVPTPEGVEAIRLLAETEGIFLDPVYTAKAMAGLISLARQGRFRPDENVVFLHTGGLPALFAFGDLLTGSVQA